MRYLLPLILLSASCGSDEPATPDNAVTVSVNGETYFDGGQNVFNVLRSEVRNDGTDYFELVLFASGITDDREAFNANLRLTDDLSGLFVAPGVASSFGFEQVGNDCSGLNFPDPDLTNIDVTFSGGTASGTVQTTTLSLNREGCETGVRIEFIGVTVR